MKPSWPFLLVLLLFPTVGTFFYFVAASPDDPLFKIGYAATKLVQLLLPIIWLLRNDPARFSRVRLSWRGAAGGLLFGLLTLAVILGAYYFFYRGGPVFDGVAEVGRGKVRGFGADSVLGFILLGGGISVVHSLFEEYYWRWFGFSELRQRVSLLPALLISSLAFAAHHVLVLWVYFPNYWWSAIIPFAAGTALGGAIWAWWYEKSGSLAGAWIAHILADVALMMVGYDLLFR
jgi:membrane protease YdiL (CAAX protease family)